MPWNMIFVSLFKCISSSIGPDDYDDAFDVWLQLTARLQSSLWLLLDDRAAMAI